MTKSELINAMASDAGITKAQAAKALDAFQSALAEAVNGEGKFALPGVGTFKKAARGARTGTTNGKAWTKAAHNTVTFKAAPGLKDAVN